jgi:hypothetical protein
MKTLTYTTVDGETVTLETPETEEEEREIQRKMKAGEVDDGHGFSSVNRERKE